MRPVNATRRLRRVAGATARAIASLAGLPPHAAVTIVATLLLATLQALAGAWLTRALLPRRRPRT